MRGMKRDADRYTLISFYVESRKMTCSADTNTQCKERLNTVFDDWSDHWGVTFGEDFIDGLTGPVVQRWFNEFMKTRAPSTINNYLSFLNPFFLWAYNIGYLDRDYSKLLRRAKLVDPENIP